MKRSRKNEQGQGVDAEVAEITRSLADKVKILVERRVSKITKTTENQVRQLREQLNMMKTKRAIETKTLKEERDQAQCELGQLKINFGTIKTERDALLRRVRNGN